MTTLHIGLSAWIIQDGNYGEFAVGHECRFAVEFTTARLGPAAPGAPALARASGCDYEILAEVLAAEPGLAVFRAGLQYCQVGDIRAEIAAGQWGSGRVSLGVDPFCWADKYSKRADLPDLTYAWRIRGIRLDTTPWEDKDGLRQRVEGPQTFRSVRETNAWRDDEGQAEYLLECEWLESPR